MRKNSKCIYIQSHKPLMLVNRNEGENNEIKSKKQRCFRNI